MEALKQAIRENGVGIGRDIVKVGHFLNHRLDTGLLFEMGTEVAAFFREDQPDLVLTVESSGIALALTTAHALGNLPVVFAKKGAARTLQSEMLSAQVHSYTRGSSYLMNCAREHIPSKARVLMVDDFLADGQAAAGLLSLINQAGASCVGLAIAIEKGFQEGGRKLRARGIKLLSLSVVTAIVDGKIHLAGD